MPADGVEVNEDNTKAAVAGIVSAKARALEKIALLAEGYAKMKCPVDTGYLRNSITRLTDEDAAYVGTNTEYAPYVELGTVKMHAQPVLRPAATEHAAQYRFDYQSDRHCAKT